MYTFVLFRLFQEDGNTWRSSFKRHFTCVTWDGSPETGSATVFHRGGAPEECAQLVLRVAGRRPVSWPCGKCTASPSQTKSRLGINDA